jgi:hypothetical protein
MICTSVIGDVSSSSIVPDRFSSEYVLIVTIGSTKRTTTLIWRMSGRISISLMLIGPWPMPAPMRRMAPRK